MKEVVIYTTRFCPFCIRAKWLLDKKGVQYTEFDVGGDLELRAEMAAKAGANTVPQIWVGDYHVGGCDELVALEQRGKLDKLLAADADAHMVTKRRS